MRDLDASRAWAAHIMQVHAKTFYFATRILPRKKRQAIEALYALFRFADDVADEPGAPVFVRRRIFKQIRYDVDRLNDKDHLTAAPWFSTLQDALAHFPIQSDDIRELLDGCESDLNLQTFRSLEHLETYASHVAGTVGRCVLAVLGATDADSLSRGERLGIAMQLTNIIRDIDQDARLGRNYLPESMTAIRSQAEVIEQLAAIARRYYREGVVLARRLPNDGSRVALLMAACGYEKILDAVNLRNAQSPFTRAHVSFSGKLAVALRSLLFAYVGLRTIT